MSDHDPDKPAEPNRLSLRAIVLLAIVFAFLAYFAAFLIVGAGGVSGSAWSSLRNLAALAPAAAGAVVLIRKYVIRRPPLVQAALHVLLAACFSLFWFWLLMLVIGLSLGSSPVQFSVELFFPSSASGWQLLQGLAVYAALASQVHLRTAVSYSPSQPGGDEPGNGAAEGPSRYFIRAGEDIRPIRIDDIVSIVGADDYVEVATTSGKHLVRMTLGEFEATLDSQRFIRVHRSHIVNVDRVDRAEPAGGGRMLLHMENGEMIQASRAGARLLRDRII